ncbi:hypothetical protein BS47DRAFT_597120 [Hydnum rufescens UP504]|uniref:Uncharacterized protein n=1 Tax=Hydnum rufescens UP504 TaxID=1448309 RepID=A0A9P6DHX8_9AGAM|nr:hypothetical protein BS47DRAFT_597120 [Hydnum rufescens UP504]
MDLSPNAALQPSDDHGATSFAGFSLFLLPSFYVSLSSYFYLRAYADDFDLRRYIRFWTKVEFLRRNAVISKWVLHGLRAIKESVQSKGLYDGVIISSGHHGTTIALDPSIGEGVATGRKLIHSSAIENPHASGGLSVVIVSRAPISLDITSILPVLSLFLRRVPMERKKVRF